MLLSSWVMLSWNLQGCCLRLQIDDGYPVSTLLFSGATLLAIAFNSTTGLLTTNTSDVYLPAPYYYAQDSAG